MDTNDDTKLNQDNAQGEANGMPISYSLETLPISLETEMKRSYLDYAMSVIVGRALPDHTRPPLLRSLSSGEKCSSLLPIDSPSHLK